MFGTVGNGRFRIQKYHNNLKFVGWIDEICCDDLCDCNVEVSISPVGTGSWSGRIPSGPPKQRGGGCLERRKRKRVNKMAFFTIC
jgi:hypothetical protein